MNSPEEQLPSVENITTTPEDFIGRVQVTLAGIGSRSRSTPFGLRYLGTPDGSPGLTLRIQVAIDPTKGAIQVCTIAKDGALRRHPATYETAEQVLRGIVAEARLSIQSKDTLPPPPPPAKQPPTSVASKESPKAKAPRIGDTMSLF